MSETPDQEKMKVFYDGSCPICTREIAFYQERTGADQIDWIDTHAIKDDVVYPGISREQALAKFHIVTPDGKILQGGTAFAGLWRTLPAFRILGWAFRPRPLDWLLNRVYDLLLKVRPRLQTWFR